MDLFKCDQCGGYYSSFEFAETIEEWLCERCASGFEEEEFYDDGIEDGYDEAEGWDE